MIVNVCGVAEIRYITVTVSSKMVKLAKKSQSNEGVGIGELELISAPQTQNPERWANAAEFVPGQVWRGSGMFILRWWRKGTLLIFTYKLSEKMAAFVG